MAKADVAANEAHGQAIVANEAHALNLLFNLGAAQQGRSMLFSDEQKLLFEGGKKGFDKNTKLDFMSW
jgi:hypothetical protein